MAGENGKVEIKTHGEDDMFWLAAYVNGFDVRGHIPIASTAEGDEVAKRLDTLVRSVYRTAYRAGVKDCQKVIKDALGLSK